MKLHSNAKLFENTVTNIFEQTGLPKAVIEKDYYVTLFLKRLVEKESQVIFKGGTSLSKCYKLVERFSEDIDINLENVNSQSQGKKKKMKAIIESIIDELGFEVLNPERIKSGWTHNAYEIGYPSTQQNEFLKPMLIVETMFLIDTFPVNRMKAGSLVYDYLFEHGFDEVIKEFDLEPFDVTVQSLERTLVDKVFALGTHYKQGRINKQSRHLYDIFKILPYINFDKNLAKLFDDVRTAWRNRKGQPDWYAAEDEKNLPKLLREIVEKEVYKKDYESITQKLLFEDVAYNDTIVAFKKAISFLENQMEVEMY